MEDTPEAASAVDVAKAPRRDWFGIIVALCALGTSAASIAIAVDNANSMDRLVQSNSWPYLQMDSSNVDDDGQRRVTLVLKNSGIGPLRLDSFEIRANGQPLRHIGELIRESYDPKWTPAASALASDTARNMLTSTPAGTVLAPGGSVLVYAVPRRGDTDELWDAVDRARFRHSYRACYCSVFDECWLADFSSTRPKPVEACARGDDDWQG